MGWKVWGEPLQTADLSGNLRVFQNVIPNRNIILRAVRIWIIFYNNPTITSLSMDIYSVDPDGNPKELLHSATNSLTKAEMITDTNGVKEVFFEFNYPVLKSNDTYAFVLKGVGYTGNDSSHIAWRSSFPDPVYRTGFSQTFENLLIYPYTIYLIGDDL